MPQRSRIGFVAALLISALAVSSPAIASNIVVNPGFETDALAPWVANPSSSFPWVVTGASVFAHSGLFYASTGCVGPQCIAPDPNPNGAWLYQDLTTIAGATYDLSFWFTPDGPNGVPNELAVLWNGVQVLDILNSAGGFNFSLFTVSGLVATGTTTRLEFLGRQDPGFNGLDDVCVDRPGGDCASAVPEPTSLVLMGTALVGLVRIVRRRS